MAITYRLEKFEGPLDLLLHLIDRNKVDIYDIPVAEITEQYLDYVSHMEEEDLDLVSDFLVMAATLLDIKSRMLLPHDSEEEDEEEDPRAELVSRLLEYKRYRQMSEELSVREEITGEVTCRHPSLPEEVRRYEYPVDLDSLCEGLTLAKLKRIYDGLIRRQADRMDPVRGRFQSIKKESLQLKNRISDVLNFARRHRHFNFDQLIHKKGDREETVITFLSVLELMRIGRIKLTQKALFDEIVIDSVRSGDKDDELDVNELDLAGLEG